MRFQDRHTINSFSCHTRQWNRCIFNQSAVTEVTHARHELMLLVDGTVKLTVSCFVAICCNSAVLRIDLQYPSMCGPKTTVIKTQIHVVGHYKNIMDKLFHFIYKVNLGHCKGLKRDMGVYYSHQYTSTLTFHARN